MDLTKGDISKNIKNLAIPASIGFFFNTMYNVVDTFYAGRISNEAIAALSLSFPIFFIIISLGTGISQGSTALISNSLGAKELKKAKLFSRQAVSFGIIISVFLTIAGLLTAPFLFRFLGAKETYLQISLDYMNIIVLGTIFFLIQSILNASLISQGDSKSFRNVLIIGFFLNLILNPIFIYSLNLGVKGIALATVIIQFFGTIYMLYKVLKTKLWDSFNIKNMLPKLDYYKEILHQGFPASLNTMTVALGIFVITYFASRFGSFAVAAYGIATRIEQIFLVPSIGFNMAVLSITGQNNGAKNYKRIKDSINKTFKYGFFLSIISGIILFIFAKELMGLFTTDAQTINSGFEYLRIASFNFFAYILLFQTVSMMQGLKKPFFGLSVGLVRQIILPIIIFPLFTITLKMNLWGLWFGIATIVWSSAIVVFILGRLTLLKKLEK